MIVLKHVVLWPFVVICFWPLACRFIGASDSVSEDPTAQELKPNLKWKNCIQSESNTQHGFVNGDGLQSDSTQDIQCKAFIELGNNKKGMLTLLNSPGDMSVKVEAFIDNQPVQSFTFVPGQSRVIRGHKVELIIIAKSGFWLQWVRQEQGPTEYTNTYGTVILNERNTQEYFEFKYITMQENYQIILRESLDQERPLPITILSGKNQRDEVKPYKMDDQKYYFTFWNAAKIAWNPIRGGTDKFVFQYTTVRLRTDSRQCTQSHQSNAWGFITNAQHLNVATGVANCSANIINNGTSPTRLKLLNPEYFAYPWIVSTESIMLKVTVDGKAKQVSFTAAEDVIINGKILKIHLVGSKKILLKWVQETKK